MSRSRYNPFVYRLVWLMAKLAYILYFRRRVFNAERVPKQGPVILASTHASFLDPPAVGTAVYRPCNYLARASLFKNPLFGWFLGALGSVPVDRDGGSASGLRTILDQLAQGYPVILFPEGTRSPDGQLQKGRTGIGLMVLKSGAPVVPVRLFGTFEAWGRQVRFPRPRRFDIKFGSIMRFEKQQAEARECSKERLKELYQEITDEIMATLAGLKPVKD